MTQSETDKVIDKIKKVLALADEGSGATPEEAANAAARVQALLEKYNLDMSMIKNGPKRSMIVHTFTLPTPRLWAKTLLNALANYNFCRALWNSGGTKAYLLGEQVNIDAVLALFDHLTKTLQDMAVVYYAAYKKKMGYRAAAPQGWKTNFYRGAVNAIWYRLDKQRKQFINDNEPGAASGSGNTNRALMVVDTNKQDLEDFTAEAFPEIKIHKANAQRKPENTDGYDTGIQAGLIVEMNKLVTEGK